MKTALLLLLLASSAFAEGQVLCIVTVGATAGNTLAPPTDGGVRCSWPMGAELAMQCPDIAVCYDPGVLDPFPDGGAQTVGPTATATDLCVNFATNPDPYLIVLDSQERNIGLIQYGLSTDAGTSGTCKFAKTQRHHP